MSLKISINSIFLSIYLIIIMLPRHYYNGVWGILENGLLLIGIFLLNLQLLYSCRLRVFIPSVRREAFFLSRQKDYLKND